MDSEETIKSFSISRVLDVKTQRTESLWRVGTDLFFLAAWLLALVVVPLGSAWLYALIGLVFLQYLHSLYKNLKKWKNSDWKVMIKVRDNDWSDGYWISHSSSYPLEETKKIEEEIEEKLTVHALKTSSLNT